MLRWNEVTWYSRWGAIILFIAIIPALCFYIGAQYQLTRDSIFVSSESTEQVLPSLTISTKVTTVSPNGKYIAKIYSTEEDTETYIVDTEGKEVVSKHPGSFISWLPDSKSILLFVSHTLSSDGSRHIFSLGIDGVYKDFGLPANTYDAAVSPYDGTIVYALGATRGGDTGDIYIRDTKGDRVLVKGDNNIFVKLAWLDKEKISFEKQDQLGNAQGVWSIDLDGTNLTELK